MSKTLLVLGEKYYLNLLVKYICNAHAMYQYYARLSNSFFAILVENSPVMDMAQDSEPGLIYNSHYGNGVPTIFTS